MTIHRIIIGDAREMSEVGDESVHLVVTSPPYWQLKDYGAKNQIGFDDAYRDYINNLNLVWEECARVLHPGCRLCVNIGDQFARAAHYGRYKVIPIREEIIGFCEKQLGLDYMGAIIWQKVTTCNTSGGATIMGSFPFPRNGIIKIDYEFILVFKKPGKPLAAPSPVAKEAARLTTDEWNEYFYGHWNFPGVRQTEHLAAFPEELPRRLIRMFTFPGETVLDPFLGSGTTSLAARRLGRNSVGYEINPEFREIIEQKVGTGDDLVDSAEPATVEITVRSETPTDPAERIARWDKSDSPPSNAVARQVDSRVQSFGSRVDWTVPPKPKPIRVKEVLAPNKLLLTDGRTITLLGVEPWPEADGNSRAREMACEHLSKMIRRSRLMLSSDSCTLESIGDEAVYVHLSNQKFVNARMIREGYARAARDPAYRHRRRFVGYESTARDAGAGLWAVESATPRG